MSKAKSAIPEGFRSLTPYLIVDGAKNFFEFIKTAFAASEKFDAPESPTRRHRIIASAH